jgi:hypothetical protein
MRGPGNVTLFEYRYQTGGDAKNSRNINQTVAAFRFSGSAIAFHLGSAHWWHKVGKALGYKTVEFSSHPQFAKRYVLRCDDQDAASSFFTPALLLYLLSLPEKPHWDMDGSREWLLLYQSGKKAKPPELQVFAGQAEMVAMQVANSAGLSSKSFASQR